MNHFKGFIVCLLFLITYNTYGHTLSSPKKAPMFAHSTVFHYSIIDYFNSALNYNNSNEPKHKSSFKRGIQHNIHYENSVFSLQYSNFSTHNGHKLKENYVLSYFERNIDNVEAFAGSHFIDDASRDRDEDLFAFLGINYTFKDEQDAEHLLLGFNFAYAILHNFMNLGVKTHSLDLQPQIKSFVNHPKLPGTIMLDAKFNFKIFSEIDENPYKKFHPSLEQGIAYHFQNWKFQLNYWTALSNKPIMYPIFNYGFDVYTNGDAFHRKAQAALSYQWPSKSSLSISYGYFEINELIQPVSGTASLSDEITSFTELQLSYSKHF